MQQIRMATQNKYMKRTHKIPNLNKLLVANIKITTLTKRPLLSRHKTVTGLQAQVGTEFEILEGDLEERLSTQFALRLIFDFSTLILI